MKRLILSGLALAAFSFGAASAQILRPVDPTRRADDIYNKNVNFGGVDFQTLSPGRQNMANSPLSEKKADVHDVNLSDVELRLLNLAEIPLKTLPQQNFTAKRAMLPDKVPSQKQLAVIESRAPITNRQIRVFMPGGDEELKKQLNTPR